MCGQGRFASTDRTRPTRVDKQMKTENIQIENKRGIDAGMKKKMQVAWNTDDT